MIVTDGKRECYPEMREYVIAYSFEWSNGWRHGTMIPNGVYIAKTRTIEQRNFWHWQEALDVRDRMNAAHGVGSHWIERRDNALVISGDGSIHIGPSGAGGNTSTGRGV